MTVAQVHINALARLPSCFHSNRVLKTCGGGDGGASFEERWVYYTLIARLRKESPVSRAFFLFYRSDWPQEKKKRGNAAADELFDVTRGAEGRLRDEGERRPRWKSSRGFHMSCVTCSCRSPPRRWWWWWRSTQIWKVASDLVSALPGTSAEVLTQLSVLSASTWLLSGCQSVLRSLSCLLRSCLRLLC